MKTWKMVKELSENPDNKFECGDIIAEVKYVDEIHFTHRITGETYGACIDDKWMKLNTRKDNEEFTIICNDCESKNYNIQADIDYDYDENSFISGYYIRCKSCGNEMRI